MRREPGKRTIEMSTPLDLDPNEVIEADDETLPRAEEDWQDPERGRFPRTWNRIFRSRYRLVKMTGQDPRRI